MLYKGLSSVNVLAVLPDALCSVQLRIFPLICVVYVMVGGFTKGREEEEAGKGQEGGERKMREGEKQEGKEREEEKEEKEGGKRQGEKEREERGK